MRIETWKSDENKEEVHHYLEDDKDTYLFGINKQLLGEEFYQSIKELVEFRLQQISS